MQGPVTLQSDVCPDIGVNQRLFVSLRGEILNKTPPPDRKLSYMDRIHEFPSLACLSVASYGNEKRKEDHNPLYAVVKDRTPLYAMVKDANDLYRV